METLTIRSYRSILILRRIIQTQLRPKERNHRKGIPRFRITHIGAGKPPSGIIRTDVPINNQRIGTGNRESVTDNQETALNSSFPVRGKQNFFQVELFKFKLEIVKYCFKKNQNRCGKKTYFSKF